MDNTKNTTHSTVQDSTTGKSSKGRPLGKRGRGFGIALGTGLIESFLALFCVALVLELVSKFRISSFMPSAIWASIAALTAEVGES